MTNEDMFTTLQVGDMISFKLTTLPGQKLLIGKIEEKVGEVRDLYTGLLTQLPICIVSALGLDFRIYLKASDFTAHHLSLVHAP